MRVTAKQECEVKRLTQLDTRLDTQLDTQLDTITANSIRQSNVNGAFTNSATKSHAIIGAFLEDASKEAAPIIDTEIAETCEISKTCKKPDVEKIAYKITPKQAPVEILGCNTPPEAP